MGRRSLILLLAVLTACHAAPEGRLAVDPELEGEILASDRIHSPLPLHPERSYETVRAAETVLAEEALPDELEIRFANHASVRPVGPPDDIDYATFGSYSARLQLNGRNLEEWNRIAFTVTPDAGGAQVTSMTVSFQAAPGGPKPGFNEPSGSHYIPLQDGVANPCYLEIGEFRRDRMRNITFAVADRGQSSADSSVYRITDIRLQRVATDAPVSGWIPQGIVVSTTGYEPVAAKKAVVPVPSGKFKVYDLDRRRTVFRGQIQPRGAYGEADFSALDREGRYVVKTGSDASQPFRISRRLWTDARWRALNFIFCQRCGDAVPGIHDVCHTDMYSVHDGMRISYGGGWHDAGDLSQQTLQTGDVAYALLEAAVACRQTEPELSARLEEEAVWGMDFLLHCRFGDGWRASSMGLLHWTDNEPGTADDIVTVRKQNLAFDNFLSAGYEAYAAQHLTGNDSLRAALREAAVEDFAFARERFASEGFEPFRHMMEHTFNTSPSQYMATVSWAAGQMYLLTGDAAYADHAAEAIRYTLACQQTEMLEGDELLQGFFYRDTTRRSLVHYIHQSREQVYMQALVQLCELFPDHPEQPRWAEAVRLHGAYLKRLAARGQYGMIPAGVYRDDEWKDDDTFAHLHLYAPADATERYRAQFRTGIPLGNGDSFRLRQFPIWFSIFNGNNAIILSQGKAAALCGRFLEDETLLQIGRDQLSWLTGLNPFGQSLIYGEGSDYSDMNSFSIGQVTGEMPVGIRTLGDGDEPYWPRTNNACYKEVWVTTAGKFLSLVAEYQ